MKSNFKEMASLCLISRGEGEHPICFEPYPRQLLAEAALLRPGVGNEREDDDAADQDSSPSIPGAGALPVATK